MKKSEIRIRDPFIYPDKKTSTYYMYGTTDLGDGIRSGNRFSVYTSKDLEEFEGPFTVFDGSENNFWATKDYWAAELHDYQGKYYLFGSMKSDEHLRATEIFVSDSPMGKFVPIATDAQTPKDWECLDGTLWVEKGIPYLVFCHEWTQCQNGEIWAVELKKDLSEPAAAPFLLFRASDNPTVTDLPGHAGCKVTDGPYLRLVNGKIKMTWSSFSKGKYSILEAEADSIHETWKHFAPRYDFDGGHAMVFELFDGSKKISLHTPNSSPNERATFLDFND